MHSPQTTLGSEMQIWLELLRWCVNFLLHFQPIFFEFSVDREVWFSQYDWCLCVGGSHGKLSLQAYSLVLHGRKRRKFLCICSTF